MALPYFENTSITDWSDLIDEFETQLLAQGWTQRTINANGSAPATNRKTREEHFTAPGIADEASGIKIGFEFRRDGNNTTYGVKLTAWSAEKVATISTVDQTLGPGATTTVNVTTTAPHGFSSGDMIKGINGTSQLSSNQGGAGNDNLVSAITVTGADTFDYTVGNSQDVAQATGGTVVVVYNHVMGTSLAVNEGYVLNGPNSSMDVFGYVDEFRICGIVQQGGNNKPFYLGQTGREHIQDDGRAVAITNTAITGAGSQTITLDRTPVNMYIGQPIWAVAADEADVEVSVIDNLVGDQLTAVWSTAFTAGAVIGWDPVCPTAGAPVGTSLSAAMSGLAANVAIALDGTRLSAANQQDQEDATLTWIWIVNESSSQDLEGGTDPDASGTYQGRDGLIFETGHGARQFMPGFAFFPIGAQNEFDIHRIGGTAVTDDFKVFVSQPLDNFALAIGPGATN